MGPAITESSVLGLKIVQPTCFEDHRGTFVETYNKDEFASGGINIPFVRDAISASSQNVLRGLHYDQTTWKLIQCMRGEIFFVVVDMQPNSQTRLKWESFILSEDNRLQVLVPPSYANGHLVLSDRCVFHYKMSEYYDPQREQVLKWDDAEVGIRWPIESPILSEKDTRGYAPEFE